MGYELKEFFDTPNHLDSIVPSEEAVLKLVAEGLDNQSIAAIIGIKPKTVEAHLHNIYDKLQAFVDLQGKNPRVFLVVSYLNFINHKDNLV